MVTLESKPRRLTIFGRVLGPVLGAKRLDGIGALVLIIGLSTFPFRTAARAFMRVSAELAHKRHQHVSQTPGPQKRYVSVR